MSDPIFTKKIFSDNMTKYNLFNGDEITCLRDTGPKPGEITVLLEECSYFFGFFEGRCSKNIRIRFFDNSERVFDMTYGWYRLCSVIKVMREGGDITESFKQKAMSLRAGYLYTDDIEQRKKPAECHPSEKLFGSDSEYNSLPPKERMRQAALAVVNMPELTEERYRSRVDRGCPFGWDVSRAIECAARLKDYGARVCYTSVYEMLNAPNDWAALEVIARRYGGRPRAELARTLSKTPALAEKSSLGVFVEKDRTWVSSLDVAERFEKEHKNVIRDIKNLECSEEFAALNFEPGSYKDSQNQERPQYFMTRDGFVFLAMGFIGKRAARFKEAYINEFNRMEELLRGAPASPNAAALGERYVELNTLYEAERKKSVTAMSTAAAARRSEQAMKRRLNKALDALAGLKRR